MKIFRSRFLTINHREKISSSCKGKKNGNQNAIKPILQYDLDNNFIKKYESITQAAKTVKRSVCSITLCAQGLTKHSAGYKWKYEMENK